MIKKMVMGIKFILITQYIRVSSKKGKKMGEVVSNGIMVKYMMGNGKTT
jgi:hypothetical protein